MAVFKQDKVVGFIRAGKVAPFDEDVLDTHSLEEFSHRNHVSFRLNFHSRQFFGLRQVGGDETGEGEELVTDGGDGVIAK